MNAKNMDGEFDYEAAVRELEDIAAKAEDPATGLADIDSYMKRSGELIAKCRAYLRGMKDRTDSADEENI